MGTNPNFTVRFYVRTTKTQGGDSPTPLRVKVWVSDTKSYLYFSTKVTTTKRIWADFSTDGSPSAGADPALVKVVDAYKAATQLVISAAIANDRIKELTSEELSIRVDAVVSYMKARQAENFPRTILTFTSPRNVPLCQECNHCGATCMAKWDNALLTDTASDLALYTNKCPLREIKSDKFSMLDLVIHQVMTSKTAHPEIPTEYLFVKLFGEQMTKYAQVLYKYDDNEVEVDVATKRLNAMRDAIKQRTHKGGNNGNIE